MYLTTQTNSTMKTSILTLSTLLLLVFTLNSTQSNAQQKATELSATDAQKIKSEQQAKQAQQFQQTVARLKLSQEQEKQMRLIMKESRNEIKALKEANKNKPKDEQKKIMTEQLQKTDTKVNAILTEEQKVVWKQIKQEHKVQMKQKREQHQQHKGATEMDEIESIL